MVGGGGWVKVSVILAIELIILNIIIIIELTLVLQEQI